MEEIFLGFAFEKQREKELLAFCKNGISMAVNQYQLGFLYGLNRKVDIISATCIGAFPLKSNKLFFRREFMESEYGKMEYLPLVNFYCVREIMLYNAVYKSLKARFTKFNKDEETIIYVYSLYLPFMKAVYKLKKEFKNIHCCLIITDLPGKYSFLANQKSLAALREKFESKKKFKSSSIADSFVFLTEQMKEIFPPRPYAVIEGFLPQCSFDYSRKRIPKSILYTGSLNKAFGIENLLNAFVMIKDKDFQLWICGAGGEQVMVEEYAKRDSRIKYYGFVAKDKIAKLQTSCDVLVNPRPNKDEFTKYSFPSKTMEYLLSGSKVVMYRLAGIPDKYYDYIYTVNGERAEDLKESLIRACYDEDFYRDKSSSQTEWIKNSKSAAMQLRKLENIHY